MCGYVTIYDDSSESFIQLWNLADINKYFVVLPEDIDDSTSDDACLCCINVSSILERTGDEWWEGTCGEWTQRRYIQDPDDSWWQGWEKINVPSITD